MGEKNSSKTRVTPLMDYLGNDVTKINSFLNLFNKHPKIKGSKIDIFYGTKKDGQKGEKAIPAPVSLLKWYIEHPDKLSRKENIQNKSGYPVQETIDNREAFFNGDTDKRKEALDGIQKLKDKKISPLPWYVFEGDTHPDIYIETESEIFVGEAKRTEPKLTGSVKWFKQRDQLIRHVDSVIDCGKKVYSFFILDRVDYPNLEKHGKDFDYYKNSLPHRSDEEVKKIMETYIGCITWDELEQEFPELKKLFSKE